MGEKTKKVFISDLINDRNQFDKTKLNLIVSGCGTGKTYFAGKKLLKLFPEIQPFNVLLITSRTMIADQQSKEHEITKYIKDDCKFIWYWNGKNIKFDKEDAKAINVMTYNTFGNIILNFNYSNRDFLKNVKIIIFDEVHALVSDKKYNSYMGVIKTWLRDKFNYSILKNKYDILFIGMTATADIMYDSNSDYITEINSVLDHPVYNYKVQNVYVSDYGSIPTMVENGVFKKKTLFLCRSLTQAYKFHGIIPNSMVLCSQSNPNFTEEMERVRNHIIKYKDFPSLYYGVLDDGSKVKCYVTTLIVTGTMREGVNFFEKSKIENVVSSCPECLNIIQFLGRCRFNVKNLYVIKPKVPKKIVSKNGFDLLYLSKQYNVFYDAITTGDYSEWLDGLKNIIDCKPDDIQFIKKEDFKKTSNYCKFINYIKVRWLITDERDLNFNSKKCLYSKKDRAELLKHAEDADIFFGLQTNYHTFARLIKYIKQNLYNVLIYQKKFNGNIKLLYFITTKTERQFKNISKIKNGSLPCKYQIPTVKRE